MCGFVFRLGPDGSAAGSEPRSFGQHSPGRARGLVRQHYPGDVAALLQGDPAAPGWILENQLYKW